MKNSITQPVCDLMNHSCQQPLITTIRLASCLPGSSSTTSTSSDHLNFYLRTDQGKRCQLAADICDLLIVVAFGHNELWRPKAAKRVSVTFQMLWLSATMNCGGLAAAKFITKLAKISPNGNTAYHSRPPHWSCCHRWNCRVHIIYYFSSLAKPGDRIWKFEH